MGAQERRRFLVPEVVQTSAMDCGPAALAAMLGGFGLPVNYGRLREACHTDVDGTSIDTLEDLAVLLGVDAAQVMAPVDHVVAPAAGALPAIVVTRLASRFTHFVVAWRRVGPYVQVMDPAIGRRWMRVAEFERDVHVHRFRVPAEAWHAWARSEDLLGPLRSQLAALGVDATEAEAFIAAAVAAPSWEPLATLDAAVRLAREMSRGGRLQGVDRLVARLIADPASVPEPYWFARRGDDDEVEIVGAVLIRISGPSADPPKVEDLPTDVAAAIAGPLPRPTRDVLRLLWTDGLLRPALLVVGLVLAAVGTVGEGLLFRRLLDDAAGGVPARLVALAAGMLVLELALAVGALQLGRTMELGLRRALFDALPKLPDPYLRSRPHSDMAERAHRIHQLRSLPLVGAVVVRAGAQLVCVVIGIVVIYPGGAVLAVAAGVMAVTIPLLAAPTIAERDLRMRTHAGALARFFLDGLLGLVPLRAHAAEATLRGEHGRQVDEWAVAGRRLFRAAITTDAIQSAVGIGLAVALVAAVPADQHEPGTLLLLAYWAVTLPVLGQTLSLGLRQYPTIRSVTLRMLEPLGARLDDGTDTADRSSLAGPAEVRIAGVSVVNAGHAVLDDVDLRIGPGEHVAVVGPAGAGKSTLAGLLVGWQQPSAGEVLVDGRPLRGADLARVRESLAWVAPEVHLLNASLRDNVAYGNPPSSAGAIDDVLRLVDLADVSARLADGAAGGVGEAGGLLSGGEGQRVRLARALLRPGVRLAVLDEPFRGVDRASRERLLSMARRHWVGATLVFVTHDVSHTMTFDRVLVIDGGRLVEDGRPAELAVQVGSLYRRLLDAETASALDLWDDDVWTRWQLAEGRLQ